MATPSYVESLLGGMDTAMRRAFRAVFEYILNNLRFGPTADATRAENFQGYYFEATTPAVAGTEFSIAHQLGKAPYLLLPVLPLDAVGAQIAPLTVTRAADDVRVYLSSTATNAAITVYLEV